MKLKEANFHQITKNMENVKFVKVVDGKYANDIIIEFPEETGIEPISFIESGLGNLASGEIREIEGPYPQVQIMMYGKLHYRGSFQTIGFPMMIKED